jgi:hypothetical protein
MTDVRVLGQDRFEQSAAQFRALAEQLDRIADAGGSRTEFRDRLVGDARRQVEGLPSAASVAAPRIDRVVESFTAYGDQVMVPEAGSVYQALRDLAARARETAVIIERCEVFERNWVDQLGHDIGRGWDKAYHHVFEHEKSDEVDREHDRLAAEAEARSGERAAALERWRRAVGVGIEAINEARAALAARSPVCPTELRPPFPNSVAVERHVLDGWLTRSALPFLDRHAGDEQALQGWWDGLRTDEKLRLREARPDLARRFPDVPVGPGDPGFCSPDELAADRYIGRVDEVTDFLGLPRLPDCTQDIPGWILRNRYQLTQVRMPFEDSMVFLSNVSTGLFGMVEQLGIPPQALVDCSEGDEAACLRVGLALGMTVPGGRSGGSYVRRPTTLRAFPHAKRAKMKGSVQGGGGRRYRWKEPDGTILEWDSRHGALEKYTKKGRHLGEFRP